MASLALEHDPRPAPESATGGTAELIDTDVVVADLERLVALHGGAERELRTALAQRLRAGPTQGPPKAEQLLLKDRHGRRCAERLCAMQDEIIRILFEFVRTHLYPSQNPSDSERMAI